jgi:hypothetical protein
VALSDGARVDPLPEGGEAVYLYCLARAGGHPPAIAGPGVDGRHLLNPIPFRDVIAVVGVVDVDDFCGPAAEARMRDLAWVAPWAYRHETVVEAVMRTSPVIPARFGTLFSSRERLSAWLAIHYVAISRALDRLEHHEEWAVKGTLNRRAAEAPLLAAALERSVTSASPSPGARYLEERRIRAGIGQDLNAWLQTLCERAVAQLREHAVEFRERTVAPAVSDKEGVPILNWAFLVPCERVGDFRATVGRISASHAGHGVVLDCSGPWPSYSFCPSLEAEGAE